MTPIADLSFLSLISNASVLVQLVMALLLAVSAMSWTYIFRKMFAIRSARAQTEEFERLFWSGGSLDALYQDATSSRRQHKNDSGALERIFESGMSEFMKARASTPRGDAQCRPMSACSARSGAS
jgi:biopolymer transport protein TolQ